MANCIVGIFEHCEPRALESALSALTSVDVNRLKVVTGEPRSDEHENSVLDFVFANEEASVQDPSQEMMHGTGMLSDSGGTSVPGLSDPGPPKLVGFGSPTAPAGNYLGGFPIPHDEVDNFNEAVERGRCVVVYQLVPTDNADAIQSAFQTAGLLHVRVY